MTVIKYNLKSLIFEFCNYLYRQDMDNKYQVVKGNRYVQFMVFFIGRTWCTNSKLSVAIPVRHGSILLCFIVLCCPTTKYRLMTVQEKYRRKYLWYLLILRSCERIYLLPTIEPDFSYKYKQNLFL